MAENVKITITAFDKTKKAFGGLKKTLSTVGKSLANVSKKAAIMGGVASAAFTAITVSNLKSIDSLAKTASKIGTTTEALSALRYAAKVSGVETTTLDMAMQRFTRRTAEAAKGTGEAKGAIKALGLDAKELIQMPLDKRMLLLSDAFAKQTNKAEKLALAFKLFDSEGAALVNTLSLGSKEMKALMDEAGTLGLVMSTDAAKGVEKANDAFFKLTSLFKGVSLQMTAGLAPAIEAISTLLKDKFLKDIKAAGGTVEEFGRVMAIDFIESAKTVVTAGAAIANGVIRTYNAMITAKTAYDRLMGKQNVDTIAKDLSIINDLLGSSKLNPDRIRFFGDDGIVEYYSDAELKEKKAALTKELTSLTATGQTSSLIDLIDPTKVLSGFSVAQVAVKDYTKAVENLGKANEDTEESLGAFAQTFDDWSKALPNYNESVKMLTNQGLNGLTDALTAGVTGAANFADAMKAMAKSVVDSLIKMLIQKYIVDAAFGAIVSLGGGGGGGGGSGGGRAIGGSVQAGKPYMVGERGQEMFVPNQSGSIVPNNKLGSSGGGVVVNQTINVTTGIQSTVRAEIVQLMPQIAQAAKGAVADARLRGGNFSKAMGGA